MMTATSRQRNSQKSRPTKNQTSAATDMTAQLFLLQLLVAVKAVPVFAVMLLSAEVGASLVALAWFASSVAMVCLKPWIVDLGVFWYLIGFALDLGVLTVLVRKCDKTALYWLLGAPLVWCLCWKLAAAIEYQTMYDGIYLAYPWAIQTASILECLALTGWAIAKWTGRLLHDPAHPDGA